MDFLTYRGESAQELWAQPLVHIAPGRVAPLFGATKSPNLRRIVDVWLAQLGIDLSARGPAFETNVRNEIAAAIAASPKLSGAKVIDGTFVFRPRGGREEELDIVIGLGSLVMIGEVKCILHPTEPKRYFRHRQTVLDAVQQVKRKAQSVLENPKDFIDQVGTRQLSVKEEFDVLPIVIIDGAIHAGVARDGVPIVDLTILRIFFEGELPMFVPLPPIPGSGLAGATFITKEVSSQAAQEGIPDEQAL